MSEFPVQAQNNNSQVITKGGQRFILVELPDDGNFSGNLNEGGENYTPFNTRQLRQAFLRKVYVILTVSKYELM